MNRLSRLAFGCAMIAMASGLVLAKAQQNKGTALIAGDRPVTTEQVLAKLQADGWSDVAIFRNGRYLNVTGKVDGKANAIAVDAETGRLRVNESQDDDDD
jgi:hypothetical protein